MALIVKEGMEVKSPGSDLAANGEHSIKSPLCTMNIMLIPREFYHH